MQPVGELFTLPPAPDELADARERDARRSEAEHELRRKAAAAWMHVPRTYRAPIPDLLKRLEHDLAGPAGRRLLRKVRDAHTVAAVLLGPTGCGKTSTAAMLVRRALAEFEASGGKRRSCATDLVWAHATEIAVAERRHALGAGEPELLVRARRAGLLVLDDLGLEEQGAIVPVLVTRYDQGLATIVTTGLTKSALTKHLGASGNRRLVEVRTETAVLWADAHDPPKPRAVGP